MDIKKWSPKYEQRPIHSPYLMCNEALRLIRLGESSINDKKTEKQIILLLCNSEKNHKMSEYQLSLAHKELADLYYKCNIKGAALQHYEYALSLNKSISVKRKIKELNEHKDDLIYSLPLYIEGEPDYSYEPKEIDFYEPQNKDPIYYEIENTTMKELEFKTNIEDNIYDPEHEAYIEKRLQLLGEPYYSSFYSGRLHRENDGILSNKELDLLTLKSMEESYNYHKDKGK